MAKCSADMSVVLGSDSFWIEICDVEHIDRWYTKWQFSLITSTNPWPQKILKFLEMHANGVPLITIAHTLAWRERERPIFGPRPTFILFWPQSSSGRSLPRRSVNCERWFAWKHCSLGAVPKLGGRVYVCGSLGLYCWTCINRPNILLGFGLETVQSTGPRP